MSESSAARGGDAPERYERAAKGLEFDRVAFFSDAVFAIAMTLLVVGIGVPAVPAEDLGDALRDKQAEIFSFFVSFIVIGAYWRAHHKFWSKLRSVSPGLIVVNLVFLAAIAFTPFPTALAGRYTDDAITVVMYAVTLSVASGLVVLMWIIADRDDLLARPLTRPGLRFTVVASTIPVVVFLVSVPVALLATTHAMVVWLLIIPLEFAADRRLRPAAIDGAR